jgi:hypothetical protein
VGRERVCVSLEAAHSRASICVLVLAKLINQCPGERECVHTRLIVVFSRQISRVLPHGNTPNRLLPVRSKRKLRKERFDPVHVRTFSY